MTGLRPLYQFFQVMQMRALEPLPVTRFNFDACIQKAGQLGGELARDGGEAHTVCEPRGAPPVV